jgi:small subunit ribosomal protein S6
LKIYETTVVIDSTLKTDDLRNRRDKIVNFISNHGGNILKVEEWGKRRLAYEIHKKQYGYYIHIRFSAPQAVVGLLEREYRLDEAVLRFLTVTIDRLALKKEEMGREKAGVAAKLEEEIEFIPNIDEEDLEEVPGAKENKFL